MTRRMLLVGRAPIIVVGPRQSVDAREQSEPTRIGTVSLSGAVVVTGAGPASPLRRARVTVQSADGRPAQTTDTDIDGISGLLPGNYFIVAVDALDAGTWEDPDVLARLQPYASPIAVKSAEAVTIDLKRVGGL